MSSAADARPGVDQERHLETPGYPAAQDRLTPLPRCCATGSAWCRSWCEIAATGDVRRTQWCRECDCCYW
jgi:hypothetical protein